MPATNAMQQLSEAIATTIDTHATIIAITGRASDNIVRWRRRKDAPLPRLAYIAGPAIEAGGLGETYDVDVTIRAVADRASIANALLRAAVELLTPGALDAAGCDAVVLDTTWDNPPDDSEGSSNADAVIAEVDLIVNLTL